MSTVHIGSALQAGAKPTAAACPALPPGGLPPAGPGVAVGGHGFAVVWETAMGGLRRPLRHSGGIGAVPPGMVPRPFGRWPRTVHVPTVRLRVAQGNHNLIMSEGSVGYMATWLGAAHDDTI